MNRLRHQNYKNKNTETKQKNRIPKVKNRLLELEK